MALFRYQFTLRQLIKVVALAAVFFAIIRTPFWPFILAFGLALPGFAIDRARGGAGLLGAVLAGMIGFVGAGAVLYIDLFLYAKTDVFFDPFPMLFYTAMMGLIWGLFVGLWARLIVALLHRRIPPGPTQGESCGPIYWRSLDDPNEATYR